MSEIKKAMADYEAARQRESRARTPSKTAKANLDLKAAQDRIVSAETRSATWTQDEHDEFDAFMARWNL